MPIVKIGAFRTVLERYLIQWSLKSLSLPTTFQAEDEGSIPFTRSNLFNDLGSGALGIVSHRTAALCHGPVISDSNLCGEEGGTPEAEVSRMSKIMSHRAFQFAAVGRLEAI
jgi:hypothetical protein